MAEPKKLSISVEVTTSPADVLDQVAQQFSEAADQWRNLADRTREGDSNLALALSKIAYKA